MLSTDAAASHLAHSTLDGGAAVEEILENTEPLPEHRRLVDVRMEMAGTQTANREVAAACSVYAAAGKKAKRLSETRVPAHTPEPQGVSDASSSHSDSATSMPAYQQTPYKSFPFDSDAASFEPLECSFQTPVAVQQTLREIRLGKRRRQRQRQKDELKHLGLHVEELEAQLKRLRQHQCEFSQQTLVVARRLNVHPVDAASVKEIWQQLSSFEREQLRTSIMENTRLRAQYECQIQIANGLKRLYENKNSPELLESSPDRWFLAKKPRNDPLSEDSIIFESLGRDFDAQYAQADAIFDAAGLTNFDGELEDEMLLRKNEHGVLYFDNLYSKVFPFPVETIDRVLGQCLTIEKLQSFHNDYKVLKYTKDMAHTKATNTFKIGNAVTTIVIRVVTKKYREQHRIVAVWEAIVEAEGAMSMRLRETGWNIIRPAYALRPGQRGPVSIEQACVRITPEVHSSSSFTEKSLAVGTLANVLIESYHKRMEQVHLVADDILAIQLEAMSLGD